MKFPKSMRTKIKDRDGNCCFFCLREDTLTVAHIFIANRDKGPAVMWNGLTLCRECHDKLDFCINNSPQCQKRMLELCKLYLKKKHNIDKSLIKRRIK